MPVSWLSLLWYLNVAATSALAYRLLRNELYRSYPFLFAYLLADAMQSAGGMLLVGRPEYAYFYLTTQLPKIALEACVVFELYRVALKQTPALARFASNAVLYVLGTACVAAGLFALIDSAVPPGGSPILHRMNRLEHTADLVLLFFLLTISAFLAWFPVRVTRNGVLYTAGFVVYFLARALGLLLTNLWPQWRADADIAMFTVTLVCLCVWLAALGKGGEFTTVLTGHRRDPDAMQELTRQLQAINFRLEELTHNRNK